MLLVLLNRNKFLLKLGVDKSAIWQTSRMKTTSSAMEYVISSRWNACALLTLSLNLVLSMNYLNKMDTHLSVTESSKLTVNSILEI